MKLRLLLAVAALSLTASAATVSYNTTLSNFVSGCTVNGTATCAVGTATLTYQPEVGATATLPSTVSLGRFFTNGIAGDFSGAMFDLVISQTSPVGTQTVVGTLSGTIHSGGTGSDLNIQFNPNIFSIAGVNYDITNQGQGTPGLLFIPAPTAGGSTTGASVQALLSGVPEPGTYAMLGAGLLGIAGLRRRFAK